MRLMCPNCEAQYEVSDSVIPLHGRDVQCSNCGQTWFQTHPQAEPEAALADDEDDAEFAGDDSLPNVAAGAWDSVDMAEDAAEPVAAAAVEEAAEMPATEVEASEPASPDPVLVEPEPLVDQTAYVDAPPAFANAEPMPDHPIAAKDVAETAAEDAAEDDAPSAPAEPEMALAGAMAAMAAEPKRRSLDEAVLSVLREEAERESKARRAAGGVETQTDMNLPATEPVARGNAGLESLPKLRVQPQAESHVADLSTSNPPRSVEDLSAPIEADSADAPTAQRQSRRDLLPDIEAFSSSLQADGGKSAAAAAAAAAGYVVEPRPARRSGFRTGFLLIVLMAVLVVGLYAAAPALGSRFPAAVPMLNQFVATIDKGRVMVDQLMQSSLDRLKGDEKPAE